MAYGTPRAIVYKQKRYCIPCAEKLMEEGHIDQIPYDCYPQTLETALSRGYIKVERVILEGQYPHQDELDKRRCTRCRNRLRKHCTHY